MLWPIGRKRMPGRPPLNEAHEANSHWVGRIRAHTCSNHSSDPHTHPHIAEHICTGPGFFTVVVVVSARGSLFALYVRVYV